MDTVMKFSQYCKNTTCKIKFIGIPKTIDNDLLGTDNCPGFGSLCKAYFYTNNGNILRFFYIQK